MKFSFEFDLEDWKRFQIHHLKASPSYQKTRRNIRLVLPAVALAMIAWHFREHGFDGFHIALWVGVSGLWFWLYPRFFDRRVMTKTVRFVQEGRTDTIFGPREVELSADGLRVKSPAGESSYYASAVSQVVETPDELLIYMSSVQAVILPRRKIAAEEFQKAVDFAREHYGRTVAQG